MKTGLRYAVFILFVIGVLVLAQSGTAWAGARADSAPLGASSRLSGGDASAQGKGTVRPPRNEITITKPGTYSVGGCLVHVVKLEPGNAINVEFIPRYHYGRRMDDDHPRFRAGTCRITQFENGKKIDEMKDPERGTAYVCFAAPRKPEGIVHMFDPKTRKWVHRPTTYEVYNPVTHVWRPANPDERALTCGQANLTGYYLVSSHKSD